MLPINELVEDVKFHFFFLLIKLIIDYCFRRISSQNLRTTNLSTFFIRLFQNLFCIKNVLRYF